MAGLIAAYIACTLAVTIGVLYPYVALLVYVAFAIVKPAEMWFWSLAGTHLSSITFSGLAVGWLLRGLADWRLGQAWAPMLALVFFWMWGWISWCNSTDPSLAPFLPGLYITGSHTDNDLSLDNLLHLGKIVVPCFIGITLLDSEKKVLGLLYTIILSQGYVAWEMNLAYLIEGYNRIRLDGFAGLDNNSIAVSLVTCCLPAFLSAYYCTSTFFRLALAASGLLILHAILLTFSRGGMVALIISFITAILVMRGGWKKYAFVCPLIVITVALCGSEVWDRFLTIFLPTEELDPAARSRLELWTDCLDVMVRFPLFGVGPENWTRIAAAYGWPPGKEAHSLWLQTGAELGLPGLAAILGYYLISGFRLYSIRGDNRQMNSIRDAVLVGLGGFIVSAQFVSLELLETPYYLTLCGLGIIKRVSQRRFTFGEI
ncbi:hypothetical protein HRbin36_00028 [bacterium HR36]|nr:hypothetical protein HRbin36_00028 [bacterium HR36]